MKIGIDIRPLSFLNDMAGLYQHIYHLVLNLIAIDTRNNYRLLSAFKGFRGEVSIDGKYVQRFPCRLSDFVLDKLSMPIEFLMGKVDIFHGPYFFIPRHIRCKSIVTIHDLMPFRHTEFLRPEWVLSIKKKIYLSVKRADALIAVSNFTKNEIVELLNIPEERIRVIHNGIAQIFKPVNDTMKIERVKSKYGVNGSYLLFVGNIEPKKNIERVIYAYLSLRQSLNCKYPLLVVGKKTLYFQSLLEVIRRYNAEKDIIFTDVVSNDELACLYSGAQFLIFPSLYEGFGIPVIEAMACGLPVITSNVTSLPEVVGDAALQVDPLSVDDITGAMHSLLYNNELRVTLQRRGFERAKLFSWEKTARETLSVYQEIV